MARKLFLFILLTFIQRDLSSQVTEEWIRSYGNQIGGVYEIAALEVDNAGNIFVSGSVAGATLSDFFTIKYNSSGEQQWVRIYTDQIEDRAIDMMLDNSGNVCVTGLSENLTGTYDIITLKYNTNGDSLWVRRYNGATAFTMDQPVVLCADQNDNVYVSGYSFGSSPMQFVTIKYGPDGDSLWVAEYLSGGSDLPQDIYADNTGNVYVYGRGAMILKYDSGGNLLWNKNYPFNSA